MHEFEGNVPNVLICSNVYYWALTKFYLAEVSWHQRLIEEIYNCKVIMTYMITCADYGLCISSNREDNLMSTILMHAYYGTG